MGFDALDTEKGPDGGVEREGPPTPGSLSSPALLHLQNAAGNRAGGAPAGRTATALFDNHRGRFWRRVRADPGARALFEDAGFSFSTSPTTAPTRTLADGSVMQATIDHIVERQTAPGRALDPSNLRISTRRENTVLLRQLHAQDPFLQVQPVPVPTP